MTASLEDAPGGDACRPCMGKTTLLKMAAELYRQQFGGVVGFIDGGRGFNPQDAIELIANRFRAAAGQSLVAPWRATRLIGPDGRSLSSRDPNGRRRFDSSPHLPASRPRSADRNPAPGEARFGVKAAVGKTRQNGRHPGRGTRRFRGRCASFWLARGLVGRAVDQAAPEPAGRAEPCSHGGVRARPQGVDASPPRRITPSPPANRPPSTSAR